MTTTVWCHIHIAHVCQGIEDTKTIFSLVVSFKKFGRESWVHGYIIHLSSREAIRECSSALTKCGEYWKLWLLGVRTTNRWFRWMLAGNHHSNSRYRPDILSSNKLDEGVRLENPGNRVGRISRSFWELEHLKISDAGDKINQASKVMKHAESNITYRNERCEPSWPWRDGFDVYNNRQVAIRSLQNLSTTWRVHTDCCRFTTIQKLSMTFLQTSKLYFVPHKEVIRERAFTMIVLVVFDTSLHDEASRSLNECLEKGDE